MILLFAYMNVCALRTGIRVCMRGSLSAGSRCPFERARTCVGVRPCIYACGSPCGSLSSSFLIPSVPIIRRTRLRTYTHACRKERFDFATCVFKILICHEIFITTSICELILLFCLDFPESRNKKFYLYVIKIYFNYTIHIYRQYYLRKKN